MCAAVQDQQKFSKVSSIVILCRQSMSELTFENI